MIDPLRSTFGLRFHPFRPDVPVTALTISAQVEAFLFRVEQQVRDGGFACITGQPGTGKSAALRLLAERIDGIKDATVGVLTRPHSNNADFYRELGHLFGVSLSPHNRWAGSKVSEVLTPPGFVDRPNGIFTTGSGRGGSSHT